MKLRTWKQFSKQAVTSMWRNSWMTVASIGTVAVTMLIVGIFLLFASNLTNLAGNLESQVEVSVYLQDEITSQQIDALAQDFASLPQIATVRYVSKEEALLRLRDWYGESADFLSGLELDNPLRNGFELTTVEPRQVLEVVPTLQTYSGVAEVVYGQGVVEQLFSVTRIVRLVALGLVIGLAAAATFIISNTIRITVFARRREISIMKYVGATDWFIRWPFIIEGMVLGFIGSLIAGGLVAWMYNMGVKNLAISMPFLPLVQPWPLLFTTCAWIIGIGMVIGIIGSTISLRRFLRV
jgi:cell division transport system permease protein